MSETMTTTEGTHHLIAYPALQPGKRINARRKAA